MRIYFDKNNERLVFLDQAATPEFWDNHWGDDFLEKIKKAVRHNSIVRATSKFLPKGSKILEGGCGRAQHVYALTKNGYDAFGIDYAPETVRQINGLLPELKVSLGDVRKLNFSDNQFDGYWSLGVIEHFYNGYDDILKEMARVIKADGYLFLVFPAFSPFRRLRSFLGLYPKFSEKDFDKKDFYQFALSWKKVNLDLEKLGFKLVYKKYENAGKTIRQETLLGHYLDKNIFLRKVLVRIVNPLSFFFGHSILLVFKKQDLVNNKIGSK